MTPVLLNPWLYIPAAAVAIVAFWLVHLALFRDRSHVRNPRPRCPKCWYDLSGARTNLPITCPECGRIITTTRDLHRTRRKPLLALIALPLMALLPALAYLRGDLHRAWYALPPKWVTVETIRVGETVAVLRELRDPDERGMQATIRHRGDTVLHVEDVNIEFGFAAWSPNGERSSDRICAGTDINDDGTKDLAVFAYSGGAHCCFTVYLLELADPPRVVATVDARNGMGMEHRLIDGRWQVVLNIADQSFDYWNAPHVASPFPSVLYRLHDHHLRIALDQMLTPPSLSDRILRERAEYLRSELRTDPTVRNPDMWSVMLDLIYAGHEDRARSFFEECWPNEVSGKAAFKQEFLDIVNKSPQYRDFKAALAAQAEGKPIPPALVGQHQPQR